MKTESESPALLEAFFTDRLCRQRQASPHTIASYRESSPDPRVCREALEKSAISAHDHGSRYPVPRCIPQSP